MLVTLFKEELLSMNFNLNGDQTTCEGLLDKTNYCKTSFEMFRPFLIYQIE